MTDPQRKSLADELEASEPIDMAAAGAAVDAVSLINDAIGAAGLRQTELAERLGISEGRISQVVNGDGNVRVSTLARFLRAAGYRLRLSASPAERSVPPIAHTQRDSQRREIFVATKTVTCLTEEGVTRARVVELSTAHPRTIAFESYDWVTNLSTGETESLAPAPKILDREDARKKAAIHART